VFFEKKTLNDAARDAGIPIGSADLYFKVAIERLRNMLDGEADAEAPAA
jgi:hypothetical protein